MIALTRWQLVILSAPLFALYAAYVMTQIAQPAARVLARLAMVAVVASALTAPIMFPLVRAEQNEPRPEAVLLVEEAEVHADLLGYFLPSRFHPTWGALVEPLYGRLDAPNVAAVHTIGFTVMVLAALGLLASSRQAAVWAACAVLYLVLSFGSTLKINGHTLGATLPYALVSRFFIMKLIRSPDRFGVLLSIPVALCAAWGICALQRAANRRSHGLVAGLAFLVLAEYAGVYPTAPLHTPAWCKRLAAEPGTFGILNLPMGARAPSDKTHMFYQLTHGKPLVEGHVSRPPPSAFAFIETVALLRELAATGDTRPPHTPMDTGEQMRLLAAGNVRYVIADKRFLAPTDLLAWRQWLGFAPAYEDEDVAMYRTAGAMRDDESATVR
jgi:hypothetical protein